MSGSRVGKSFLDSFVDDEGFFGYSTTFYAIWVPAAFLALATALSPKGVCNKAYYWARGFSFFWMYNEKKGMGKAPDTAHLTDVAPTRKTVIFIRHGESDWNEIFNKNKLLLLPRLVHGLIRELLYIPTSHSVFIDSPLSQEGITQAVTLRSFLGRYKDTLTAKDPRSERLSTLVKTLNRDEGGLSSVMVTSNLRRAINTGCICMWNRLRKTSEKILLLESLQEMSRNVDTNALAGPQEYPEMSVVQKALGKSFSPADCLDASNSSGNKGMFSKALPRMEKFNKWVFSRQEDCIIVASGHSLWIRNYFKTFLPKDSFHDGKVHKMVNCGAVALELVQGKINGKIWHRVEEESIAVIHGGFKSKKSKKK